MLHVQATLILSGVGGAVWLVSPCSQEQVHWETKRDGGREGGGGGDGGTASDMQSRLGACMDSTRDAIHLTCTSLGTGHDSGHLEFLVSSSHSTPPWSIHGDTAV